MIQEQEIGQASVVRPASHARPAVRPAAIGGYVILALLWRVSPQEAPAGR